MRLDFFLIFMDFRVKKDNSNKFLLSEDTVEFFW